MGKPPHDGDRTAGKDRSHWPVRVFSLGDQPGDDLSAVTTPTERLAMVWPLTLEAWSLAGLPVPDYDRAQTPVKVLRKAAPGDG